MEPDITAASPAVEPDRMFPLLKLAAETRLNVFKNLLVKDEAIFLKKSPRRRPGRLPGRRYEDYVMPVSGMYATILRVCQLFHDEGICLLYGRNLFTFDLPHGSSCNLIAFEQQIGPKNLALVRHVRTKLYAYPPSDPAEAQDLNENFDAADEYYSAAVKYHLSVVLLYFGTGLKDLTVDILTASHKFKLGSNLRALLQDLEQRGLQELRFIGLADEELGRVIQADWFARRTRPNETKTSDDDVIFVSSTKNCRHHDSSTSTVHDGSDADSDDFRISKALGKELMEALSDPKIQSLELDWSPQDLKSRLKSFNTSGLSTP